MNEIELIKRLEKAMGPDRELDLEIAFANGWKKTRVTDEITGPEDVLTKGPNTILIPRFYTKSIDAALTLVPEGYSFYVDGGTVNDYSDGTSHASVFRKVSSHETVSGGAAKCSSPAIAFCIASLKARAYQRAATLNSPDEGAE